MGFDVVAQCGGLRTKVAVRYRSAEMKLTLPDETRKHSAERFGERSYRISIRRLLSRPLRFRRFHPPRQIVGETRKRLLQRFAALADWLGVH
jgi:hypothetical protein